MHVNSGQLIPCSVRWIPEVLIIEEEPLEGGGILQIIDTRKQYSRYTQCFSAEQAARLPKHQSWDHQIPLPARNVMIPTGAIYKTTWEEDKGLRKYMQENISTEKARRFLSAATAPILFVHQKKASLRLCVDYSALNCLTIPTKYPL